MATTKIQAYFAPIKQHTPQWVWQPIRNVVTAIVGPIRSAYGRGYYHSTFKMRAVAKDGKPLPWYTYSMIDFLAARDYSGLKVLEFGSGQSTLWWAQRAEKVVALEGDADWFALIEKSMPSNVELVKVDMDSVQANIDSVRDNLASVAIDEYDVIVIDGLYRGEMVEFAQQYRAKSGVIICDDSHGYQFNERLADSGLLKVDFHGMAPGVILRKSTSIYFPPTAEFLFSAKIKTPEIF